MAESLNRWSVYAMLDRGVLSQDFVYILKSSSSSNGSSGFSSSMVVELVVVILAEKNSKRSDSLSWAINAVEET